MSSVATVVGGNGSQSERAYVTVEALTNHIVAF